MGSLQQASGAPQPPAVASGQRYPAVSAADARAVAAANMIPSGDPAAQGQKLDAAKQAALAIQVSLLEPGRQAPAPSTELKQPTGGAKQMGVCIHWNCRGFGILRSQVSGEVFVHVKALNN